MKDAEELLKDKYKVSRAPFGWYKWFNVACKGHPLSELSRSFSSDSGYLAAVLFAYVPFNLIKGFLVVSVYYAIETRVNRILKEV